MDTQLLYIIGFTILTFIALVVSLTFKYEHTLRMSNSGHPPGIDIVDVETPLQSERDELRTKISNLTADGESDSHHTDFIGTGVNNFYYTYDNELVKKDGAATITNLNGLFSHNVFYPVDWRRSAVLIANISTTMSFGPTAGTDSHMTYNPNNNIIASTSSGGQTLYLNYGRSKLKWSTIGFGGWVINSYGELCMGDHPLNVKWNENTTELDATTSDNSDYNVRLVATTNNTGKLRFSFFQRDTTGTNKNINNIEYFGITSANNYPLPAETSSIFGDPDISNNITTFGSLSQTLKTDFGATRDFGLFAKTNTIEPTTVPTLAPSSTEEAGYVGFTSSLDPSYYRIEYTTTHFLSNSTMTLHPLFHSSEVAFGNQPYYSIHVVITEDDSSINDITFVDGNNTKGTQTIVIFGSPRSGYKEANKNYGLFLSRGDTPFSDPVTDIADFGTGAVTDKIYKAYGNFNMNALAIMKFNNDGQNHGHQVNTSYTEDGWSITSTPNSGYEEYIPINYGTSNPYQITKADYLNYYYYDTNTYTHYYYDVGASAWKNAYPEN